MQTKIHNLKRYTPAQIESFRARMEAEKQRQEEYAELSNDGPPLIGVLVLYLLALAVIGLVIYFYWQSSDRLVGLVGS